MAPPDRAAAVRAALRTLVARDGFHGASMSAVAREAGVATGTAYTYYSSKEELIIAAYVHTKAELASAATATIDPAAEPESRFQAIWIALYRHLASHREHAVFLLQVECSPYRERAHEASLAREGDPLIEQAARPDLAARLAPLPIEVIYELSLAPAVRLAAEGRALSDDELLAVARACWRAVSVEPAAVGAAAR